MALDKLELSTIKYVEGEPYISFVMNNGWQAELTAEDDLEFEDY